jgi:nucleoside-triphosphatase THEP1
VSEQYISSASSLAELLVNKKKTPELIIISGLSGAGKSSWCLTLARQARSSGVIVGGVISPPVFINGHKVGIDLVVLLTGERRRLAVRYSRASDGLRTANWLVDPQVLAWGNQQLLCLPSCDCVILDELGPLEFNQGQGLQAGLKLIDDRQLPLVVAVIRPKLLPLAQKRWPRAEIILIESNSSSKK